jgi:ketose-bisphosphate aldolase
MPLVSIKDQLMKASQAGYAVPLFDVFDSNAVDGLVEALEEKRAPTIFGVYNGILKQPNAEAFCEYIKARVKKSKVPVSIMLDHGESVEQCRQALDLGFTDVMFDGSRLPIEDNIACTIQVVKSAHLHGAGVEAELGHVGSGSNYDEFGARRLGFTDTAAVENFVRQTSVDFLAVAFGNAHGIYKGEPKLDLELLREIRGRVPIPLVMHGGSGLDDQQYRDVVAAGIAKINYFTGIMSSATERMVEMATVENPSMMAMTAEMKSAYVDICSHYFDVFGTSGRA